MRILVDELPKRNFECLFGANMGMWYTCSLPIDKTLDCFIEHGMNCPYLVEYKEADICELGGKDGGEAEA